jgi:hypothetical protein
VKFLDRLQATAQHYEETDRPLTGAHRPCYLPSLRAFEIFIQAAKGEAMNISQTKKKQVFRLFAAGKTPEQVRDEFKNPLDGSSRMSLLHAEQLYEKYIALSIGEKLRLTLMTECVSNRVHRLMDDISDLTRVDTLLAATSEKTLISLLDIKRKIKERMAKEFATGAQAESESDDDSIDNEVDENYEKIFGGEGKPAQASVL